MGIIIKAVERMIFYTGMHLPYLVKYLDKAFVSVNVLKKRRSDFEVGDWIMDSGAFTEISTHGYYRNGVEEYAEYINRWSTCGNMELAVAQDYMCEPFILEKTGLSVEHHQVLTIQRYRELLQYTNHPIMPVLQGFSIEDYLVHLEMYGGLLGSHVRVGVGSVCKRNSNPRVIATILEAIKMKRPDLRLHGFGIKYTALQNNYVCSLLYSADSMAWSFAARKEGRDPNSAEEALSYTDKVNNNLATKAHQLELLNK